jgi:hypothetical protein
MRLLRLDQEQIEKTLRKLLSKISHSSDTVIRLDDLYKVTPKASRTKPVIHVLNIAADKMRAIVAVSDKEVAWHGVVTYSVINDRDVYTVHDIVIYPQKVTAMTVESDDDKYPNWTMEIDDDTFNHMRMQGHSHVNMGVTPSSTDLSFYDSFVEQVKDFYIFMILNKAGAYTFKLYDIVGNMMYDPQDLDVVFETNPDHGWAQQEIAKHVKPMPVATQATAYFGKGKGKGSKNTPLNDDNPWDDRRDYHGF